MFVLGGNKSIPCISFLSRKGQAAPPPLRGLGGDGSTTALYGHKQRFYFCECSDVCNFNLDPRMLENISQKVGHEVNQRVSNKGDKVGLQIM